MDKPKISIIIPEYNNPKTLPKTLKSINGQSFKDYEIIIVDDYSVNKPIESIRNIYSKGSSGARNTGILKAKADILAFIDSDCYADKDWLKNIYNNIKTEQVLMGKVKIPNSTTLGNCISLLGFPAGGNLGFENVWKLKNSYTDHISSCNFAIKKNICWFDESFPLAGGEDAELSYRLTEKGIKIRYCDNILVWHEPRKSLWSFVKWQLYRGRSNYHFKKKIKNVNNFIKLRIGYSKNVIVRNIFDFKILIIIPLLFLSFILQQAGYIYEKFNKNRVLLWIRLIIHIVWAIVFLVFMDTIIVVMMIILYIFTGGKYFRKYFEEGDV